MNKKHLIPALIGMAALAWGVASCDNGCEQTRENYMHVSFVSNSGRTMRSMEVIVSTGETGYQLTGINKFDDVELDLSPNDSVCYLLVTGTYVDFGDSFQETDTVRLEYTRQPYFLDMNCGCTVNYELQSVESTHHLFTEVEVVDPVILTESGINMTFVY